MLDKIIVTPTAADGSPLGTPQVFTVDEWSIAFDLAELVASPGLDPMICGEDADIDTVIDGIEKAVPGPIPTEVMLAICAPAQVAGLASWKFEHIGPEGPVRWNAEEVSGAAAIHESWNRSNEEGELAFTATWVAERCETDVESVLLAWMSFVKVLHSAASAEAGISITVE